jgi:hypothetical protein
MREMHYCAAAAFTFAEYFWMKASIGSESCVSLVPME